MGNQIHTIFIETSKIPREKYKKFTDRVFLNNICIAERREPDKQGNTLSVYLYDKDAPADQKKLYIGAGKVMTFDDQPVNDNDLPPGADEIVSDAEIVSSNPDPPLF
jgi:hypothetical protein